ncbi:MAG: cation-transporting P-type ATPase, partial [Syntrophomonadaceae bacterium]|nr:cation-transporting P-type ATPase [Syntrophomonadaceae bacterium]
VTAGSGRGVVYATGMQTELGKIAGYTQEIKEEPSPLQRQIGKIVKILSVIAVSLGVAFFLLGAFVMKMGQSASFMFAIGIIVANVPEGLLPTVTLALATGVQRMARRNALIRRLSAVETLSATTVICTDKTGTLTENQMTACWLWVPHTAIAITGVGYAPEGEVRFPAEAGAARQARLALAGFALCSDARLQPPGDGHPWRIAGDPTEGALLVAARKAGLDPEALAAAAPRVREIPFEPRRKMMTVAVRWQTNDLWPSPAPLLAFTKGAPLELLARCRFLLRDGEVHPLSETERAEIVAANDRMARDGHRVLGLALRPGEAVAALPAEEVEQELVFVALAALMDPPRPEVPEAIALCRQAGIAVTMVTGDYGLTAEAIGRRIGMVEGPAKVISGADLDRLSDQQLEELLRTGSGLIFARALPEQKLRLVQAYQAMGHVVAVTGDGVNDAPALHAAHIGIAMGMSGTDVARAAADMVLVDDNFATIVAAVEQGRAVYSNIRKFMTYILASNVPEIVPFLAMAALRIP